MPTAAQNEIHEIKFSCHSEMTRGFGAATPGTRKPAAVVPEAGDHTARLAELLAEDPVDLTNVSDEIRSQPSLAAAVKRIAASLQLLPQGSVSSVEEAAIVLGTERLRVLLHAWPTFEKAQERDMSGVGNPGATVGVSSGAAWTPESVYLASFARLLGLVSGHALDSSGEARVAASGGVALAELTETLVRDFLALIPRIDPRLPSDLQRREDLSQGR